ncbi:Hsp20/alpha crystallin family protein [Paucisalibacillus globulus]|uniref:Hsp20/alpha crystallin family protein n=1 Tax=Paucisalibacillus globulus TaxID=351095 RepID=UPI00040DFDCA|nr:Hsp20/alpha crystallin family protein [Paucisalibacillus globulus]
MDDFRKNRLPGRFDIDMTPLNDFMKHMDSFFNQSFKQMNEHFHLHPFWVDVKELNTHYLIQAKLDGYRRDQIQIEVEGNKLRISIDDHRLMDQKDLKGSINYKQQTFSKSERVISLPFDIPKKEINASFKNNKLSITIPKRKSNRTIIDIEES